VAAALGEGLAVAAFVLVHLVSLLLVPLGLPGTFVQVAAAAVVTLASGGAWLGWGWTATFLAIALVAEGVEFLAGVAGARRYGGSRAAAWGALLGGIAGAIVGVPIPVVGSVVASWP
jgi:uncharacterized protein YqgC (DUF456 family)